MKRTELKAGRKSVERRSTFKVPRAAMKRKNSRRVSPDQRAQAGAFRRAAAKEFCAVCRAHPELGTLISPIDAHHVVAAQWLRANVPDKVYDVRNVLPLCRDCHERHENASRRVPFSALTEANLEFAREVLGDAADLYLDRRYPGRPQRPNSPNHQAGRFL